MPHYTADETSTTCITADLKMAELALDQALIRQSQLLTTMLDARQKTGDPFIGQGAMLRLVRAQQSLLGAGGDLARVHGSLLDIGRERGAVIHDCPPNEPMEGGEEPIKQPTKSLPTDRVRPLRPAIARR